VAFAPNVAFIRQSTSLDIGKEGNIDLGGNAWKPDSEKMGVSALKCSSEVWVKKYITCYLRFYDSTKNCTSFRSDKNFIVNRHWRLFS